jgi:hypothetical protein
MRCKAAKARERELQIATGNRGKGRAWVRVRGIEQIARYPPLQFPHVMWRLSL